MSSWQGRRRLSCTVRTPAIYHAPSPRCWAGLQAASRGATPYPSIILMVHGGRGQEQPHGTSLFSWPPLDAVRIGGGELGGMSRQVLVSGRASINRAVHGDTVAVRLLPRGQWRSVGAVASSAPAAEDQHDLLAAAAAGDGTETAADEAAEPGVAAAAGGSDAELDDLVCVACWMDGSRQMHWHSVAGKAQAQQGWDGVTSL